MEKILKKVPCVILCGGKSSRMGSNKALLPFNGAILAQYMYERMQKIFENVFLVAKDSSPFSSFAPSFIQESGEIYAPLIGIERALESLREQRVFFLSVDTPFITRAEIDLLFENVGEEQIFYAKTPLKSHFLCGIYQQSTLSIIKEMIEKEDFKMSQLISRVKSGFVEFEDEESFSNLNTPQDYQNALKRLEQNG